MDPHHRCQLYRLQDLLLRGAGPVLHVATHARPLEMRRRGIDRDQDQFLVLLRQRAFAMRDATEC